MILFLVDAVTGLTPGRPGGRRAPPHGRRSRSSSPSTRSTTRQREADAAEFYSLGWEETYSISASHGRGTGDLLDAIVWALPPETEAEIARKTREDEADEWARDVAAGRLEPFVVGDEEADEDERRQPGGATPMPWPPAGTPRSPPRRRTTSPPRSPSSAARTSASRRSSTALLGRGPGDRRPRCPGTTRDAIDTTLEWGRSEVVLIDTAGIRRRGKVAGGPAAERYSTLRSLKAIGRADVAVLVIDAVEGLTAQDAHVAGYVVEEGKGLVIAVNKWDLVEDKTDRTFDQYVEWIRNEVPFLDFAPVVSISAKTGQRVGKVLELAVDIWGERRKRVSTGELNRILRAAVERQQPPVVKGRRPKIFYGTQAAVAPPTFVFFANDAVVDPLQLPALPREPAPRRVRLPRDADQADLPRPRLGQAAAPAEERRRRPAKASSSSRSASGPSSRTKR